MMKHPSMDPQTLRAHIAALAARLIAVDGADYASAKRKAAHQLLGDGLHASALPDDRQVEEEVRQYHALFSGPAQPARVFHLRTLALQVMALLAPFRPYLTGAVLSASAGEHDDIQLQLFAESGKDVEIFLLNQNLNIEISETPHFKGARHDPVETVSFLWRREGVHAQIYALDDLRGALKARPDGRLARIDADALRHLMNTPEPQP
ncbi:MAG: hypothetical protein V4463_16190 [Pseudomonadota bacterium]